MNLIPDHGRYSGTRYSRVITTQIYVSGYALIETQMVTRMLFGIALSGMVQFGNGIRIAEPTGTKLEEGKDNTPSEWWDEWEEGERLVCVL
jgi:hypothetical protein